MPGRLFKKAVQQDHHERPGQAYFLMYVESLGAARTVSPVGCSRRLAFSTHPAPAILLHPPDPPIASQSISRDAPFTERPQQAKARVVRVLGFRLRIRNLKFEI
jgi:hypothetical protein